MKPYPRFLAVACAALLTGCASLHPDYTVPVPEHHAKEYQLKLEASRHWDAVARDVANESVKDLDSHGLSRQKIQVMAPAGKSTFSKALHNFLVTHLVGKGADVLVDGKSNVSLKYDIQVVRFQADRSNRSAPELVPGTFTVLTAGVLAVHNALNYWDGDSEAWGLLATTMGADAITATDSQARRDESYRAIPKAEIIVTTSLLKDNAYLMRRTDVYYVDEADAALYDEARQPLSLFDTIRQYDEQKYGKP